MRYDISIITPSFNQGKFIERTIKSVLDQHMSNLQYLVIDGGSTDETVSILNKYPAIKYVSEKDNGQTNALNKGFKESSGDIIGWLNSDDVYFPETLTTVLDFFQKHPDVDILYGDAYYIDEHDQFIRYYPTEKWSLKNLMDRCFISQPSVFFRRALFEKYGFLDENLHFCMDYEYWLRLASRGATFSYLPKVLSATRLHRQSKTIASSIKAHEEQIRMIAQYQRYIPMRMIVSLSKSLMQSKIKNKILFLIFVACQSIYFAFKYNGFFHGIFNCFFMPKIAYNYIRTHFCATLSAKK
ncbi:MAG TPA: glycosyltransferase family 2 protein [Coxiellaceae bacterium]|nr:MAG: hypothetical protein A3E81_04865 [Gammaproteobacteria bacterium RIFCSPHIGHO2_12_FULL_36_30]HLB55911.1 glycosyltransferase family 2 protein [Coxiellaceae bacterium]